MRKNLKDEPTPIWSNQELLHWVKNSGVIDEAHSLSNENKQYPEAAGKSKKFQ